jgi:maltooligosyltrehalose synthase
VAFGRTLGDESLLCVVPRLSYRLNAGKPGFPIGSVWGERRVTGVPPGRYRNVLTGRTLELADNVRVATLLDEFPLALLIGEQP